MKKISFLLCCVLLLQILCACNRKKESFIIPTQFYYGNKEITYNSSAGVIRSETREGDPFQGDVNAYLRAYLLGPESSDLKRIIPADVYLISCQLQDGTAYIVFSNQFARLSGMNLLTACSALLLSMNDFSGVNTLCIRAEESQLDDKDEFIITMDDIVLTDAVETEG